MEDTRVPCKDAAQELNTDTDTVRSQMREENLPIGAAVKCKNIPGYMYYISRRLLDLELAKIAAGEVRPWQIER